MNLILAFKYLLLIAFIGVSLAAYSQSKDKKSEANLVLDKVGNLPEVLKFMHETPKSAEPRMFLDGEPDSTINYYRVKVGISNFDVMRSNFIFYVKPKTLKIYYWDVLDYDNSLITLHLWRSWRDKPEWKKLHIYKNGKLIVISDKMLKKLRPADKPLFMPCDGCE
ncbi:MAG: hypothetical protein EOP46_07770 [Sphingobacteriaceae bacterium]|nr:MAG: hypothetical protein EOP46_07770 [Sphingobacteriaceae bacterium]